MKTEFGKNINEEFALFFYDINNVEYNEDNVFNISNLFNVMKHDLPEYFERFYELTLKDQLCIYEQSKFYTLDSDEKIIRFIKTRYLLSERC